MDKRTYAVVGSVSNKVYKKSHSKAELLKNVQDYYRTLNFVKSNKTYVAENAFKDNDGKISIRVDLLNKHQRNALNFDFPGQMSGQSYVFEGREYVEEPMKIIVVDDDVHVDKNAFIGQIIRLLAYDFRSGKDTEVFA